MRRRPKIRIRRSYCQPFANKKGQKTLHGSPVKVGTVIAFPLGEEFTGYKGQANKKKSHKSGAQDVDVVAPISQIKQGSGIMSIKNSKKVKRADFGKTVKIIIGRN